VKYSVCCPDQDPDDWTDVEAFDAELAATTYAEDLCSSDPEIYSRFEGGDIVLVRADGSFAPERFEVTVESVPHFSALRKGTR
jgi:hypothetical protein